MGMGTGPAAPHPPRRKSKLRELGKVSPSGPYVGQQSTGKPRRGSGTARGWELPPTGHKGPHGTPLRGPWTHKEPSSPEPQPHGVSQTRGDPAPPSAPQPHALVVPCPGGSPHPPSPPLTMAAHCPNRYEAAEEGGGGGGAPGGALRDITGRGRAEPSQGRGAVGGASTFPAPLRSRCAAGHALPAGHAPVLIGRFETRGGLRRR